MALRSRQRLTSPRCSRRMTATPLLALREGRAGGRRGAPAVWPPPAASPLQAGQGLAAASHLLPVPLPLPLPTANQLQEARARLARDATLRARGQLPMQQLLPWALAVVAPPPTLPPLPAAIQLQEARGRLAKAAMPLAGGCLPMQQRPVLALRWALAAVAPPPTPPAPAASRADPSSRASRPGCWRCSVLQGPPALSLLAAAGRGRLGGPGPRREPGRRANRRWLQTSLRPGFPRCPMGGLHRLGAQVGTVAVLGGESEGGEVPSAASSGKKWSRQVHDVSTAEPSLLSPVSPHGGLHWLGAHC